MTVALSVSCCSNIYTNGFNHDRYMFVVLFILRHVMQLYLSSVVLRRLVGIIFWSSRYYFSVTLKKKLLVREIGLMVGRTSITLGAISISLTLLFLLIYFLPV